MKKQDWEKLFWTFHEANPKVYALFKKFTREMIEAQRSKGVSDKNIRCSSELVVNRIRWEEAISTTSDDGYKVNQSFKPYYSRLFAKDYPNWAHIFEFRDQPSKRDKPDSDAYNS